MKVIYDEAKAKEDVERFQKAERKHKTFGWIFLAIGLVGCAIAILGFLTDVVWLTLTAAGLVIPAVIALTLLVHDEDFQPSPSVAAKYYMAAENKKVQAVRIETRPGAWHTYEAVCLLAESDEGTIETTVLCSAKYQENTKVQEATFDVHKGIVYVPYEGKEEVLP